ncbi:L-ornithine N5-oxygenase [Cladophialophora carrionii]|uniref:L-ornithine N(5)-monooxygenase n=1 Tax=Cladophialophora carrionii TaxID=86049 RepID=A0A1C1CF33_9EURO|nr:L-ornithine N5-oxygenase [Cladophialophora carrionii]
MDGNRDTHKPALDLVCVGFDLTGIANAVALNERNGLSKDTLFLESQLDAFWKPLRSTPASRLRTSFLNDLITSENPRSRFTFMNYLHATNRLILYANSGQLRPSREMFSDYLRWCATRLQAQVLYGKMVTSVQPLRDGKGDVAAWEVVFVDAVTGEKNAVTAKQVVYAASNHPHVPKGLRGPALQTLVLHSSEYQQAIPTLLRDNPRARIAVVGNGQNAAEAFAQLHGIWGEHEVVWFTQDAVLRGDDETPFLLESITLPSSSGAQNIPPEIRRREVNATSPLTSSSSIEARLLAQIYDAQYDFSVKEQDPKKWRFQIRFQHEVVHAERTDDGRVRLFVQSPENLKEPATFDTVISATGFGQHAHYRALKPLQALLDGSSITVDRDYHINLRKAILAPGCGIWLQGSLADGGDQTLAERSRRLAESVLRRRTEQTTPEEGRSARL